MLRADEYRDRTYAGFLTAEEHPMSNRSAV